MRTIMVVSGSRADAGPLRPLRAALSSRCNLRSYQMTAMYDQEMHSRIALKSVNPDIVVLLGDRYETLVFAGVASEMNIPIAHLSGGDVTEGANDDAFRHAITKLAYWHFPICYPHADRIRQMGEPASRIYNLGAPGVDQLMEIMDKDDLQDNFAMPVDDNTLVSFHPETLSNLSIEEQIDRALSQISGTNIFITGSNSDKGGERINERMEQFARDNPKNVCFKRSYPSAVWFGLMEHSKQLIGNSSAFILEAMTLRRWKNLKYGINIVGDRQKGRYEEALKQFAFSPINAYPFGKPGEVSNAIADKLVALEIPTSPRKVFHAY